MASKEENKKIESILLAFSDELIQRYYVCEQPIIKKSDSINLGYRSETIAEKKGKNPSKKRQSINLGFTTIQPSRKEIQNFIKFFVSSIDI